MKVKSRRVYVFITVCYQYAGMTLALVIGVFLVPLYLQYIPAQTYGLWLASGNILSWVSLIDPGLAYVMQRQVAQAYGENNAPAVERLLGSGLIINLVLASFFLTLSLLVSVNAGFILNIETTELIYTRTAYNNLPNWPQNDQLIAALLLCSLGAALNIISYIFRCGSQAMQVAGPVGLVDISSKVVGVVVVVASLHKGYGIVAMGFLSLGTGLVNAIGFLLIFIYVTKINHLQLRFSSSSIKALVAQSGYNALGKISTIAQTFDLLIVARLVGAEDAAILGLTRRALDFLRPLILIPVESAGPAIAHLVGERDVGKLQVTTTRSTIISIWLSGLATAGCIGLNPDFVRMWVGSQFYGGQTLNILLCVYMSLLLLTTGFSSLAFYLGDIKQLNIVGFLRTIILLLFVLIGAVYGGVAGVVKGTILALLMFLGYPIWSLRGSAGFSNSWLFLLLREAIITITAIVVSITVISYLTRDNWFEFAFSSTFLIVAYSLSMLLSPLFRELCFGLLKRLAI